MKIFRLLIKNFFFKSFFMILTIFIIRDYFTNKIFAGKDIIIKEDFKKQIPLYDYQPKNIEPIYFEPNDNKSNEIQSKEIKPSNEFKMNLSNPHDFKLILTPGSGKCNNNTILITMVTIAPKYFYKRLLIRNSWGKVNNQSSIIVFLIGNSQDEVTNNLIREENLIYSDIIQEDFIDSYYNLTIKVMMGFKWIDQFCSFTRFVLKIDDDVVPNIYRLLIYLNELINQNINETMLGNFFHRPLVYRNKTSKFYISFKNFPNEYFPPFCGGSAYILTRDLVGLVYEKSLVSYFPPFSNFYEDVYIGMLLSKLERKNKFINIQRNFSSKYRTDDVPIEITAQTRNKTELLFIYVNDFKDYEKAWDIFK